MKLLVASCTLIFCALIVGVNLMAAGARSTESVAQTREPPTAAVSTGSPAGPGGTIAQAPASRSPGVQARYTLAEVGQHRDAQSCWMAIDGEVYDFTAYLPKHPADPQAMLRHCGKEASQAFRTKDAGRPHSPYAAKLMQDYRIGTLQR